MSSPRTFRSNESAEVVIVGGGVIGLTIARSLAARGVRDVMLIERAQLGAEASWAAGGILAPQIEADYEDDFFHLTRASRDMYPSFANSLTEETGIDVELDQTGTLYLGFSEEDEFELRQRYEWQAREGLRVEWLTTDDARRLEPNISPETRCALRFPNDWQVDNRRLVQALVKSNQELGVKLITECEVRALRMEQGKVRGVETSSGFFATPILVLAAGAWTSLLNSPDVALPEIGIEPARGQMLCFQAQPQIVHHVICNCYGYLVPRRDGRLLAGSTIELVGFDKDITIDGYSEIMTTALELAPGLEQVPVVDSWAGFRPWADDGLPVLGSCPEIEGLFYATGHYRNGILLAPITGELIADAILSGAAPLLLEAFSPSRFDSLL